MSTFYKLFQKMRNNPRDWRIDQLEAIAKQYGVVVRKTGGGSHVIFDHSLWVDLLSVPARRPIKPVYIKKFVALIELLENADA